MYVYLKYNILLQDPFFKNSWDDFDRLRQDMVKESKEFWNKAEAIQMEKPKAEEGAAPPPPTPMFFPVHTPVCLIEAEKESAHSAIVWDDFVPIYPIRTYPLQ